MRHSHKLGLRCRQWGLPSPEVVLKSSKGRKAGRLTVLATVAAVILVAGGPAGEAAAGKAKVVNINARGKMVQGNAYVASGQIRNRSARVIRGKLRVSLSKNRGKAGGMVIGRTRVRVGKRSRARYVVGTRIGKTTRTGNWFISACFRGSCRSRAVTISSSTGPTGPTGPSGPTGPTGPGGFTDGATTGDDPLLHGIGNGGYDADNYSLNLVYDPVSNEFGAGTSSTMTATATQDLSGFSLDFKPSSMTIGEVTVNDSPVQSWELEDVVLSEETTYPDAKLVIELAPGQYTEDGDQFEVTVAYSGYVDQIVDPDSALDGWIRYCRSGTPGPENTDCHGAWTTSEPLGAMSYFPSNNLAGKDKATFQTTTTIPAANAATHTALGSGELVSNTLNGDGTRTFSWDEEIPMPPYLHTVTVAPMVYEESTFTDSSVSPAKTGPLYNLYDITANPGQIATLETRFDSQQSIIDFYTPWFGPYPLNSGGIVAGRAAGVGYALENQGKSHFAGPFNGSGPSVGVDTLNHEYAHQWFGNTVGPATWLEIWFNEGWAAWAEWLAAGTRTTSFDEIYALPEDDWVVPPATLDGDPAKLFDGMAAYDRPAAALEGYAQIVGDEKMEEYAKTLMEKYGYSSITTDQAVKTALDVSEFEGARLVLLRNYWHQWLYWDHKPDLTPADFII